METDKYTKKGEQLLNDVAYYSLGEKFPEMYDIVFLKFILENSNGTVPKIIQSLGVEVADMLKIVNAEINNLPRLKERSERFDVSPETYNILSEAEKLAPKMNDLFVSVEHIFLAIFEVKNCKSFQIIDNFKIDKNAFTVQLNNIRKGNNITSRDDDIAEEDYLKLYGRELVALAKEGKIDPVIGREDEIRDTMMILSRRKKNNPVLIGEAGVGKTAIVEGIAHRIVQGNVPNTLKNKKIFELNIASLTAGTQFHGMFEERLKKITDAIEKSNGEIILFIDEIHTIVGGGPSNGVLDAGNILKPKLARGDLHCIGATTLDEYRIIEKDKALERRFRKIIVEEPGLEDTIAILRGIKEKYEIKHGVKILDAALITCAKLTEKYITDRFQPDKSIDIIDDAGARIRMEMDSSPVELEKIKREITLREMERESLKKETSDESKKRYNELSKEIEDLKEKQNSIFAKWENEKNRVKKLSELKEKRDEFKLLTEKYEKEYNYEKLAELNYKIIPENENEIKKIEESIGKDNDDSRVIDEEVDDADIFAIISKQTNIPLGKLNGEEKENLINLSEILHKRIVGQNEAVEAITDAITKSRVGLKDEGTPIGSFLFMGPTGVGKTEIAKALAEELFDDEKNLIRIDMSEFTHEIDITKLIGSPPGYIGYEEGGHLTEKVRRHPYSVILFDEIEKAHSSVYNIFLQILDDGRLTDSMGRTVDFKNTVIIFTSNIASNDLIEGIDKNGELPEQVKEMAKNKLKRHFSPEFQNRFDDIIVFSPLKEDEIIKIIDLEVAKISKRLKDKKIKIVLTDESKKEIADKVFDPAFGARPVKRYLSEIIETEIAKKIIKGEIKEGDTYKIGNETNDEEKSKSTETNSPVNDDTQNDLKDDNSQKDNDVEIKVKPKSKKSKKSKEAKDSKESNDSEAPNEEMDNGKDSKPTDN